jgi:hypothetical protein
MKQEINFRDLLDVENEEHVRQCRRYYDDEDDGTEFDDELAFEEEHKWDGLDSGFSSWQDYYNYMYG